MGTLNGCTYHGITSFDLTQLPSDASIASATLRLYTPDQTTATGVQVYPNLPPTAESDPSAPPSWASAPAISGTAGLAQTGSDGHWQSWDVTSLVQQWAQDSSTNGGLTLESGGTPVAFASPLGAGNDAPALAPYLDIVYAPAAPASPGPFNDGAQSIYGVSGSFTVVGSPGSTIQNTQCTARFACQGNTKISAVSGNLGGSFIRVSIALDCASDNPIPSSSWWGSAAVEGTHNGSEGSIIDLMTAAYNKGLIPIVNFTIPDGDAGCHARYSPDPQYSPQQAYIEHWRNQMSSFVNSLPSGWKGGFPRFTYFEIGNEQNIRDIAYYGASGDYYPLLFRAAASGLYSALHALNTANYRVLTDGVVRPAATDATDPSGRYTCGETNGPAAGRITNHLVAMAAIDDALQGYTAPQDPSLDEVAVPDTQLGLGVHPYHFTTANTYYWRNYYTEYGVRRLIYGNTFLFHNYYPGLCGDLGRMIALWTDPASYQGHRLPVVFTEDNWSAQPLVPFSTSNNQYCWDSDGCEGAYLADLFTWLYDKGYAGSGAKKTATEPLRVMWYRGADKGGDILGLYGRNGTKSKSFHLHQCGQPKNNDDTDEGAKPSSNASMTGDYKLLRHSNCY